MSAEAIALRRAHRRLRAKILRIEAEEERQEAIEDEEAFLEHCKTCEACRESIEVQTVMVH